MPTSESRMGRELKRGSRSDLWSLGGPVSFVLLAGFALAYWFADPAPPGRIVMATGPEGGAYAALGERYQAHLAAFDIEVALVPSAGSEESLAFLRAGEVDVAFVQGGLARAKDRAALESLGSLYYEPLWVFLGPGLEITQLAELTGRRIAVGAVGSGTRAVALELLARNGVEAELLDLSVSDVPEALWADEVDAAFLIASPASPVVRSLLLAEQGVPFSFSRAAAYSRTHRFLSPLLLPEGMIDYARNIPDQDIRLVAPTAHLVVEKGLHPALVDLLVQAAERIHGGGGVFEAPGEFPSPEFLDLPLNAEARRFYEHGPPFLQRYLPFWLATLVDRLKVMLIPLVALLIPVFRLFPPLYRWRVRSRIYRWYTELREIDPRNRSDFPLFEAIEEARRIEDEVAEVEAPASYAQELYHLRLHLEFVQRLLNERRRRAESLTKAAGETAG